MLPTATPIRDPKLTGMVLAYKNAEYVGDSVGPMLEVDNKFLEYPKMDKLNLFQDIDHTLARGGEANEVGAGGEKATARLGNFALKATILKEDIEDEDDWWNEATIRLDVLQNTLALQREKLQAAYLKSVLVAASRTSDPGNWADFTGSAVDVFTQIKDKMEESPFGYDSFIIPEPVLFKLQRHPKLLSQYFDGNTGMKTITIEALKEMFGVSEIIVPKARIATVRRPAKVTDISALGRVWGNDFIMFKKAKGQPNMTDPGFYYQWRRRWVKGAVGQNMQVRTWELPTKGLGGAYVVQQEYQAHHMVFAEAAYAFTSVLT